MVDEGSVWQSVKADFTFQPQKKRRHAFKAVFGCHRDAKNYIVLSKLIGSGFRVQGLPAFGGAEGDQGSKVATDGYRLQY
jgi:hypothetical protein